MIELTTTESKPSHDDNLSDINWKVELVKVKVAPKYIQSMTQYSEYTRILLYGASIDVKETIEEIETLINKTRIREED